MSRLWRYGTVYSRTRDFIVGKYHSWESRPVWFDVWTKHPPLRDPVLLERTPVSDMGLRERWDPEAVPGRDPRTSRSRRVTVRPGINLVRSWYFCTFVD